MSLFTQRLDELIEEGLLEVFKLIKKNGVESEHSNTKVLKIVDSEFNFNLSDSRWLSEISEDHLIDNEGYAYSHFSLSTEDLLSLVDFLIEGSK